MITFTDEQFERIRSALQAGLSCASSLHCSASRRDRTLIRAVLNEISAEDCRQDPAAAPDPTPTEA
jgi:mitochondrial fission protein ELM1